MTTANRAMNVALNVKTYGQDNKCGLCTASKCCRYITHQIDTPRSKSDFDHMLWQISHELISFYKDEGTWYMVVDTSCRHLLKDGRCGIYDERPQICREHSNENCEFDSAPEDGFELYFTDYSSLLKYCKKRFSTWGK